MTQMIERFRNSSLFDTIGLGLIDLYQKYISPKKGFSCSHRLLYGGTGCSGAVKQIIKENGLFHSKSKIKERFAMCRASAEEIKKRRLEAVGESADCLGGSGDVMSCDGLDCSGCDCGGL